VKNYRKLIESYSKEYRKIITQGKEHTKEHTKNELPGNTYFLMEVFCVFLVWMEIIDFPMGRMGLIFGLMLLAICMPMKAFFHLF